MAKSASLLVLLLLMVALPRLTSADCGESLFKSAGCEANTTCKPAFPLPNGVYGCPCNYKLDVRKSAAGEWKDSEFMCKSDQVCFRESEYNMQQAERYDQCVEKQNITARCVYDETDKFLTETYADCEFCTEPALREDASFYCPQGYDLQTRASSLSWEAIDSAHMFNDVKCYTQRFHSFTSNASWYPAGQYPWPSYGKHGVRCLKQDRSGPSYFNASDCEEHMICDEPTRNYRDSLEHKRIDFFDQFGCDDKGSQLQAKLVNKTTLAEVWTDVRAVVWHRTAYYAHANRYREYNVEHGKIDQTLIGVRCVRH